jgi:histidinol phosphatase-like PHP family hydrolase
MKWQPTDCHCHSTMSDGALDVHQIVERAATLGVRPTVSDHASRDVSRSLKSNAEIRGYLDVLTGAPVLRAAEFCWHDALWRELPPDVVSRFTHRVGSLHAVILENGRTVRAFSRGDPGLSLDAYMDAHLANAERFAREMPVDILAHPTLVPFAFRQLPSEEVWTEPREERLVTALRDAGIAFEISNRYPPHERLVRRAASAGVRMSLGSDGHTADQVANLAAPLAMARAAGVQDEALYDPERHGSRTGWAPPAA